MKISKIWFLYLFPVRQFSLVNQDCAVIICPTHMSDSDLCYYFTYIHNLWRCKQIKLVDIGLLRD